MQVICCIFLEERIINEATANGTLNGTKCVLFEEISVKSPDLSLADLCAIGLLKKLEEDQVLPGIPLEKKGEKWHD